ncbi:CDP-diacylglycerol--glycerol-3-phosphate 3-phosphatidyltransferase [Nitrospinae bacterium AH_259_B05_G02_I21]|nr:CDP-diacylglycerol--glycerol-3-phosphate 3-phosphatidyltransferase [Nitrospinae bacterium AH_259_B05_G02_I21]MDA2931808.1 CDP-diacylglycerol--glycerol-3-phosphate 3-phosphatidyltransferase [Nitrospinae bacterium AH-259-F20]
MLSYLKEQAIRLNGTAKLSLPNKITLARIFIVPLIVVFLIRPSGWSNTIAGALFILASLTDWLDGHLARSRNQVTDLGKMLDPIADKILVAAGLIPLVALGRVPVWMAVVLLGREFAVTGLRFISLSEGLTISASRLGKYKTILQVVAVSMLILHFKVLHFHIIGMLVLWVALFVSVISAVEYFINYWNPNHSQGTS